MQESRNVFWMRWLYWLCTMQIGNRQTSDHLVNVAEVKELIDEAMERGDKKGLFGKRRKGRTENSAI